MFCSLITCSTYKHHRIHILQDQKLGKQRVIRTRRKKENKMVEITRSMARSWWPRKSSCLTSERAWDIRIWCWFERIAVLEMASFERVLNFDVLKLLPRRASNFLPMFFSFFFGLVITRQQAWYSFSLELKRQKLALALYRWQHVLLIFFLPQKSYTWNLETRVIIV